MFFWIVESNVRGDHELDSMICYLGLLMTVVSFVVYFTYSTYLLIVSGVISIQSARVRPPTLTIATAKESVIAI